MPANPFTPGDIVSVVHRNGVGEGVLWRVKDATGAKIRIVPIYTVTGASVLNPKTIDCHNAQLWTLTELGFARVELDRLIRGFVALKAGACTLDDLESNEMVPGVEPPSTSV